MSSTPAENASLFRVLTVWTALWLGLGVIISFALNLQNYESLKLYYITSAYYIIAACFGVYYYKVKSMLKHHDSFNKQLLLIVLLYICSFAVGIMINSYFPISEERRQQIITTRLFFPLWTVETWSIKLAEIIFQQTFIFAILHYIDRIFEYSKQKKMTAFALTFTLIHLPLLVLFGWRGLYFIVPSFFAGFIFSYLILTYRLGLFYSFLVHVAFYFAFGSLLRYTQIV